MKTVYVNSDKESRSQTMWDFFFCALSAVAISAIFLPYQADVTGWIISAVCGVVFVGLRMKLKDGAARFVAPCIILAALLLTFGSFSRGMLKFINDNIILWNTRFNTQLVRYEVQAAPEDTRIFFAIFMSAVGIFIELLCSLRKEMYICVVMFIYYELQLLLRVHINVWVSVFIGVSILMLWIRSANPVEGYARNVFAAMIPIAAVAIGMNIVFASYNGSARIENLRNNFCEAMHDVRYGKDTLPDGDMRTAYSMLSGSDEALRITTEYENEEYLTGFVASDFDGVKWSEHSYDLFKDDWSGIFKWLEQGSFYAQTQYAKIEEARGGNLEATMKIENVGADRSYVYVPYSLSEIKSDVYSIKNDLSVKSTGLRGAGEYSVAYSEDSSIENVLAAQDMNVDLYYDNSDYLKAQRVYSGFVDDAYTEMDEAAREMINGIFFDTDKIDEGSGLYSVITRIRSILELRAKYSENPPAYNGSREFTDWFLNEAREGNSAYFATAAAMALRAAGYPSRYAEGYYIKQLDEGTTIVTQKNSHAWAEVYIENIGWVPVEVTPGFYSTRRLNQETVEISRDMAGGASEDNSQYNISEEYKENDINTDEDDKETRLSGRLIINSILALLLAAMEVALVRPFVIMIFRRVRIKRGNAEKNVYGYIFKALNACKIQCDRTRPYECREAVCERFKEILPDEYDTMVSLMQLHIFGQKEFHTSQTRTLLLFAKKLRRLIYRDAGMLKRIKYFFGDCI